MGRVQQFYTLKQGEYEVKQNKTVTPVLKTVALGMIIVAALLYQVLVWFVWYRLAGYNHATLLIAQLGFAALAILLLARLRIHAKRIGLSGTDLLQALVGIALAYSFLLAVLLIINALGGGFQVFRQSYRPTAILDNWLLTGLGEELFFAGVLFNVLSARMRRRTPWLAVLITAALFALWHLPGYLAVALRTDQVGASILFDMLRNLVSWGIFGTIYICSENLWLAAFAHASTDYALLPVITNAPVLGLLFFLTVIAIAWWLGRKRRSSSAVIEE